MCSSKVRDDHSTCVSHSFNHDIAFCHWYTANTRLCGGSVFVLNTIDRKLLPFSPLNLGKRISFNLNCRTISGVPAISNVGSRADAS